MKRFLSSAAAAGLLLTATAVVAPSASADERTCRGTLRAVTVDDVKVPRGATCRMYGTRVKGNIKVYSGAKFTAARINVDGDIQSQGHQLVKVEDSRVDGNIQLEQGRGLTLNRNIVDGDIQVFSNRSGYKNIYSNRVDGNLQCKSNSPAPKGARNIVKGNKEDQCRRL